MHDSLLACCCLLLDPRVTLCRQWLIFRLWKRWVCQNFFCPYQGDNKPWITGQALAKHQATKPGGEGMQMQFFFFFCISRMRSFFAFFFASVLPSVFLFSGKPWTDVYHVVLQMMLLLMLTIPLS